MTPPDQPTPPFPPEPAAIPWFLEEGARVRDYTVLKPIGEGSGSMVYEVEDKAGVHFALKMSRVPLAPIGKNPVQCERFYQGAGALLALRGSINVVKLAEVSLLETPQGAYPYLVMELVPRGECITAWAARTNPTLANLVEIFIDLADTLGMMADLKICHRDLKPQNILIAPEDVPKISDLNSASFPTPTRITASAASAIPGTLAYFSPQLAAAVLAEMTTGKKARYEYAPADDLYSLGCVFYELLVGEVPCCDLNEPPTRILRQIVSDKPRHLTELNTSIPLSVSKVVMRLLEKDPAKRYQSGYDVAEDLRTALSQTADLTWSEPFIVQRREAAPKHPWWLIPAPPSYRRLVARFRRRWVGKLALAAMLTLAALVAWLILGQHCPPETSAEKGLPVLCKVKMALMAAPVMLSCAGLMGNVRADEEKYLAECPAAARETVKSLNIVPSALKTFDDGPTVKKPGYGYELKAGPIEIKYPSNLEYLGGGSLFGEIRVGADGASVHITKLKLNRDGIERPVCGIASADSSSSPGFPKLPKDDPNRVPDSKLHPDEGFIYVIGGWVYIELAQ